MSDITSIEKRKLERLFCMGGGYVLNFTDRTFGEFFDEHTRIDIDAAAYQERGTSKANRLRAFLAIENNHVVGKIVEAMILYGQSEDCLVNEPGLTDECLKISKRLSLDTSVTELNSLTATVNERDFETVAQHVREAIEKNQPEAALDRLHIFVIKYIRTLCELRGIEVNRDKALHSIFGEYVKRLKEAGHLESVMTERIIKSSISVLEAFNDVRNNQSLAHDNPILNYEESLLIFNHVASSIRFIKSLESRIQLMPQPIS
jgi:Abortive infection C-terminus